MLRRKKEKLDKPYCFICEFHGKDDRCDKNPERVNQEYLAHGKSTLLRQLCGVKNHENLCTDFKRK